MAATATPINPAKSPPVALPMGFILFGALGLVLLQLLMVARAPMLFGPFRFNAVTLTAVHLFTLWWATAVMMGAFYQLTPVILLADAPPVRGAVLQGALYAAGVPLLIYGFYNTLSAPLIAGGTLIVLSVLLFAALILRVMRTSTAWNITGTYMVHGLAFLVGTVLWGLVLALNFRFGFIRDTLSNAPVGAHLILGVGGWFGLTILGVSYQLVPMFALSHRNGEHLAKAALWLIAGGLWTAFFSLACLKSGWATSLGLLSALTGILVYSYDMYQILKRRRRPNLDLGMRYAVTSYGFLALTLLLAVLIFSGAVPVFTEPQGQAAVVYLALLGFVASMIIGMLYKIVPFLIWHQLFRNKARRPAKMPTLNELFSPGVANIGYLLWVSGVLLGGVLLAAGGLGLLPAGGGALRWSSLLTLSGSLCFVYSLCEVIRKGRGAVS